MTAAATAAAPAHTDNVPTISKSTGLIARIAGRFSVDPDKLMTTLKLTAFRQRADDRGNVREPTNEEMMALLILADQYKLNPFTRELFAYFDPKSKAIIPVVSVDGWIRIINEQPSLRSMSFTYSPETVKHKNKTCHEWMEVEFVRADRDKPIVIREYFAEVVREVSFATPWDSHPNRMHRHKTIIQGARVAFGFGGIYDEDEASRIIEGSATIVPNSAAVDAINAELAGKAPAALTHAPGESVPAPRVEQEGATVTVDNKTGEVVETKTEGSGAPALSFAHVKKLLDEAVKAKSRDKLDEGAASIALVASVQQQKELTEFYRAELAKLEADDGK